MLRRIFSVVLMLAAITPVGGQPPALPGPKEIVNKIQSELSGHSPLPDLHPDPHAPPGEFLIGAINNSKIFPGTNYFEVYVPAQYDPAQPACLLIQLDGYNSRNVQGPLLDDLIAKKDVPILIAVGISPGGVACPAGVVPGQTRFDRSYEFDSMNDHLPEYILNEVLPAVEKLKTHDGRPINISPDPNDHATVGTSTGGIAAFTLAWRRPDQFRRVYSVVGTFVAMRGGNEYPVLIRKTEPKPIRIFLEDGSNDAWNPLFGSWFEANESMESALSFAGYEVAHAWGTHGHNGIFGEKIFPDVMRWLWHDYPSPVRAGVSHNDKLQEITMPGQGWQKVPRPFQSAAGLAADPEGEIYLSDAGSETIYRLDADDKTDVFREDTPGVTGEAFGPNGILYGVIPAEKKIVAFTAQGAALTVADGIAGHAIVVAHDGTLYVSAPGEHSDMPSEIWQIKSNGEMKSLDRGLSSASGVAFSPDGSLFFAAENSTKWIYSYAVQPDGSLGAKQPYYWLHMTDIPNDSGAEDLAVDTRGNLYAATGLGVQVCDRGGRVRAILPLPTPCGPVRSLCFGGPQFNMLYVTDGTQVFKRPLKVPGFPPWSAPIAVPVEGAY